MARPEKVFREILSDISSPKCLSGLSIGLVVGLMLIVMEVSFATMIFSGPLNVHVQNGIGMVLAGTIVFALIAALFSGIRPVVGIPQDAPAALFAGIAAAIAATIGRADSHQAFITITAALMFSCLLTGGFFIFVGWFRLAEFFRFMPYPVVSGFLAGTGWLLTKGSLEVMTGMPLAGIGAAAALLTPASIVMWLPGVAFAIALFALLRYRSHYLVLPCSLVLAVFLYHVSLWVAGISLDEARLRGFIFESFAAGSLWPPFGLRDFLLVEWNAILKQIPAIAVVPFISILGLLLNTGGIEMAGKMETDMNRELTAVGSANLLAGITGSHAGYSSISLTVLGLKVGADTRLVGLMVTAVMAGTLLFGSKMLALFPKAVLGSFVLLLGLFFISDWLVDTFKKMPRSDYLLVVAVFLVICLFGYLQGVVFGLLMTMILFVVRISRIPLLRRVQSGASIRSRKGRPLPHQRLLAMYGDRTAIYELEGYIFFGSATRLIEDITSTVADTGNSKARVIILNFSKVNGFDISSINNFVRLINRFNRKNMAFAFAGAPEGFNGLLAQNIEEDTAGSLYFFPDMENALQWAEDRLLDHEKRLMQSVSERAGDARGKLFDSVSDELMASLDFQARVEELMEKLERYLSEKSCMKDEVILPGAGEAEGLYMVRGGVVVEFAESETGQRIPLRNLAQGTVFAELGAFGPWISRCNYTAGSHVELRILTREALEKLERDDPSVALELHRLLIDQIRAGNV